MGLRCIASASDPFVDVKYLKNTNTELPVESIHSFHPSQFYAYSSMPSSSLVESEIPVFITYKSPRVSETDCGD